MKSIIPEPISQSNKEIRLQPFIYSKKQNVLRLSQIMAIGVIAWWLTLGCYTVRGKSDTAGSIPPTGIQQDDTGTSQAQATQDAGLWVNASNGNDSNNGRTRSTAFASIQKAASIAGPGTTVHILPGIYRETVRPALSGTEISPIIYRAENGPGTVIIRGSEQASTLSWTKLTSNPIGLRPNIDPSNLYYADLSAWALKDPPRFVVQLDSTGNIVTRLPLAREPNWQATTDWKYGEFWWAADGGSTLASCDPASDQNPNCDVSSRSSTQLIDQHNDSLPAGIETGNLTTLGNLTGATLVAMDTIEGHYVYRRKIIAHDVASGKITVDRPCEFDSDSSKPSLGWGTKYYIENHPALLDTPGEWWYDKNTYRLYLWPLAPGNPSGQNIEISRRDTGFDLSNHSYITLDGLTLNFINNTAINQISAGPDGSYHNTVRNVTISYANIGVELGQGIDSSASRVTDGFTLENSDIGQMDTWGIRSYYWWPGGTADSFIKAGIVNTLIRNNELHDLGFRSDGDNPVGVVFMQPDRLRFEGNHVHHVAQNGVQLSRSVIQSSKQRNFSPTEIKTSNILIKDNVFEKACLLTSDCGGLKIWGSAPDGHVFRNLLITGNVFRNTYGWTYISQQRKRWVGGKNSLVQGMGGFGLYVDNASGIHVYRNIAYNNAFSDFTLYNLWWDGDVVYYNNVAANSLYGIRLDGYETDNLGSTNTQIANNILANNEGYGILIYHAQGVYGNFLVNNNLYYINGWRAYEEGGLWEPGDLSVNKNYDVNGYYPTLADIQASTPWEKQGVEGDPHFWNYNPADHDLFDGSWPDFFLTSSSTNAIDKGTKALPASLTALLTSFGVVDYQAGSSYDIGRYEAGFLIRATPTSQSMEPGGTVHYSLSLFPSGSPYYANLSFTNPSSFLAISLSSKVITNAQDVVLSVIDSHVGPLKHGEWYNLIVTGAGSGFTRTINLGLLVGGYRSYLPSIMG